MKYTKADLFFSVGDDGDLNKFIIKSLVYRDKITGNISTIGSMTAYYCNTSNSLKSYLIALSFEYESFYSTIELNEYTVNGARDCYIQARDTLIRLALQYLNREDIED